jgi:hypothetical protein
MVNFYENFVIAILNLYNNLFKKINNYLIYNVHIVVFQKFKKQSVKTIHTLCGSFFHAFTQFLFGTSIMNDPKFILKGCLNFYILFG